MVGEKPKLKFDMVLRQNVPPPLYKQVFYFVTITLLIPYGRRTQYPDFSESAVAMAGNSVIRWLEERFEEVSPWAFYRDLFPLGFLDQRDAMTKGKYCGIAVQVLFYDDQGATKSKALRFTLTDELDNIEDLISSDLFTVISPLSYAGKSQKAEFQRQIFAIAIDLDNTIFEDGEPVGLSSLFSQIERAKVQPRPTYVVASSAKNLHLYYLLEEPINAFAANKESLARYKTALTKSLWNRYVTNDYDKVQQEPVGQSMRAVGSVCKNPEDGRVRAFLTGDKVNIEYLNRFVTTPNQIKLCGNPKDKASKGESSKGRKSWCANTALYQWWLRQMDQGAVVGRRYFCCLCAAVFAKKSGISREQLEQDILDRVPQLDAISTSPDNRFTVEDALKALTAYDDSKYMFLRRATLERLSGIAIPANKRNGRKQKEHVKRMTVLRDLDYPNDSWRNTKGAPTKESLVKEYAAQHPRATQREIAKALGISPTTVNKWLRE